MQFYDILFKHIASEFPKDVAEFLLKTSNVEIISQLSTEQTTVRMHHSDMTYHVRLPDEEAILHIEAQTDDSTHKPMPLRMLAYSSYLALEHEKNVYSTVLYFRPPAGQTDPGFYRYGNEERGGVYFRYNVIRIYELEGEMFLDPETIGLLPLTVLMKPPDDMTSKTWVDKCIQTIQMVDVDKEMRGTLLFGLSIFGSLVHPDEYFQDPLLEAIMQESPFYDIVIQRGDERGYKRGIEQGARTTAIKNILAVLQIRFSDRNIRSVEQALETIGDLEHLSELHLTALQISTYEDFLEVIKQ